MERVVKKISSCQFRLSRLYPVFSKISSYYSFIGRTIFFTT